MGVEDSVTPEVLKPNRPTSLITEIDGERQDWINLYVHNNQLADVYKEKTELERKIQLADGDFSSGFTVGVIIATLVIAALYGIKQLLFYTPPDMTGW
jgi:hypothetical protein